MPIESNTSKKISKKTIFLIAGAIVLVAIILGIYAYSKSVDSKIKDTPNESNISSQNKDTALPATIPDPIQPIEAKPADQSVPPVKSNTTAETTKITEPKSTETQIPTSIPDKGKNTPVTQPETKNTSTSTPSNTSSKPSEPINTPSVPLNEDRGAFDF